MDNKKKRNFFNSLGEKKKKLLVKFRYQNSILQIFFNTPYTHIYKTLIIISLFFL